MCYPVILCQHPIHMLVPDQRVALLRGLAHQLLAVARLLREDAGKAREVSHALGRVVDLCVQGRGGGADVRAEQSCNTGSTNRSAKYQAQWSDRKRGADNVHSTETDPETHTGRRHWRGVCIASKNRKQCIHSPKPKAPSSDHRCSSSGVRT
jgi:hypothetical protein